MVGLIPGLGLGIIAGLIQIGVTKATEYFETLLELEQQQEEQHQQEINSNGTSGVVSGEGNGVGVGSWTQEQEDELDAKVRNMSTEEIQKEIEALKEKLSKK